MKKLSVAVAFLLSLSGCQKFQDYYKSLKEGDTPNCDVMKISSLSIPYVRTFFYHDDGRPDYVVSTSTNEDGLEFIFTYPYLYDDLNRLVEIGLTTESPTETTYVYEGASRLPVRDTIYQFPYVFVEDLEYDAKGRLLRILKRNIPGELEEGAAFPDVEYRYYYDVRGNRQEHPSNPNYPGIIEYTDKPSIYSLNPVWQLQFQNYSRNSTLEAETYNSEGLPLITKSSSGRNSQPFYDMGNSALEYLCK